MATYSIEDQRRMDAIDMAEGKRGGITMVSISLQEYKALKEAATNALQAFRYMRDKDTQHWDFHVTPEICTAWDNLRAALALVAKQNPDVDEAKYSRY